MAVKSSLVNLKQLKIFLIYNKKQLFSMEIDIWQDYLFSAHLKTKQRRKEPRSVLDSILVLDTNLI